MPNKYLDSVGLAEYTTLIKTALDDKADLDSPALTGTPTAPTPTAGDDSTKVATTAFVQDEVANYLPLTGGSVTGNLTVSGTITGNVTGTASGNLPLSGGTMTGTIETSYSLALKKNDSNNYIQINSGVATADGSNLVMCAKGYSGALGAGVFQLTARDTNEYKVLYGKPDGTLTWGGSNVITAAGGTLTGGLYFNPDTTSGKGGVVARTDSGIRIASEAFGMGSAGAYMDLYGRSYSGNAGTFVIVANSASGAKNLTGKTDGTLTWDGLDITPQTASTTNTSSDVSVPNNTAKNLLSFSITKGTWLVQAVAQFPNNATGYRRIVLADNSTGGNRNRFSNMCVQAANGLATALSLTTIISVSSTTTIYLNVTQTSGGSLNVSGGVERIRLSADV